MELIDKEKLKIALCNICRPFDGFCAKGTCTAIDVINQVPTVNAIDRQQFIDWLKTAKFHDISDGKGLCLVMFKEEFEDLIKAFK